MPVPARMAFQGYTIRSIRFASGTWLSLNDVAVALEIEPADLLPLLDSENVLLIPSTQNATMQDSLSRALVLDQALIDGLSSLENQTATLMQRWLRSVFAPDHQKFQTKSNSTWATARTTSCHAKCP